MTTEQRQELYTQLYALALAGIFWDHQLMSQWARNTDLQFEQVVKWVDAAIAQARREALLEAAKMRCEHCRNPKLQPARSCNGFFFVHWEIGYPEAAIQGGSKACRECKAQEEYRLLEGGKEGG